MKTVVATGILGLWSAAGFAMCPYPTPKACNYYFTHDVVFVGKVLSERWTDDYIRFRVEVVRVLRGQLGATATVYTGNDSARLQWDVGRTYVVFAGRRSGRLESGNDCGPLSDPDKVDETLREIHELRTAKGATIEGEVLDRQGVGKGVPGVSISVRGGGSAFQTRSDANGRFLFRVPAGRYELPLSADGPFQSDYNGDTNLRNMALVDGQCAQIQLVAR
jgi:hypothetical protein